jgi:DNA-binding MarR family transcriptional regulator
MGAATSAAPPAPMQARIGVVFGGLLLVMLLAALDQTIVSTALPTIVGELGGLGAGGVWLLARLARDADTDPHALAPEYDIDPTRLEAVLAELEQRGLVLGQDGAHPLTPAGEQTLERLTTTSQQRLEELASDWHHERYPELPALILGLAREFLLDAKPLRGPTRAVAAA